MTETEFVGRRVELELLNNLWTSDRATLLILYGRRRVGKTRLLTHWLTADRDRGLYWVAEATSSAAQLRSFTQAIYQFESPDAPPAEGYSFATWEQAFHHVAQMAEKRRIALLIDEVTYLIMANPDFASTLQKAWDRWLKKSNLMLVLSGSHVGLMQKKVLAYDAPLYGRDTARTQLPPMPFWTTHRFFPDYSPAERVATYAVLGGIPAYWERLRPELSLWDNIRFQLLPSSSWMMDEPQLLLRDFFSDTLNYVSLLRAIAQGAHTQGKIVGYSGLPNNYVSSYLATLRDTGFVTREVPVTEPNPSRSRRGRYQIADPYLRFFYRFVASYQSKLALGGQDKFFSTLDSELPAFIGDYTWRQLCAEWLLMASDKDEIPLPVADVGGYWYRHKEIEVVGIDRMRRSLVLATCHWGKTRVSADVLQDVLKLTSSVVPKQTANEEPWRVFYLGFSAAGWEPDVQEAATQLVQYAKVGKRWHNIGARLVTLAEVDEDLRRWSY